MPVITLASGTPRASARARDFSRPAGLGKAKNCREALHRPPRGLANFGFTQIRRSQDIQTTVRFYGRLNSTMFHNIEFRAREPPGVRPYEPQGVAPGAEVHCGVRCHACAVCVCGGDDVALAAELPAVECGCAHAKSALEARAAAAAGAGGAAAEGGEAPEQAACRSARRLAGDDRRYR